MTHIPAASYTWLKMFEPDDLTRVLNAEFPGWKDANFVEDFDGQTMYTRPLAVAFRSGEDATQFILKYGEKFAMIPSTELWYHTKPF